MTYPPRRRLGITCHEVSGYNGPVLKLLRSLHDLAVPVQCAGCCEWDTALCESCWLVADAEPVLTALDDQLGVPTIPVHSLGKYGGKLRKLILAAKHDPAIDLDLFLKTAGARIGESLLQEPLPATVWVVPAPSSWKRRLRRAGITTQISQGVAAALREGGVRASVEEIVALRWGAGSQSSREREQRRRGRSGQIRRKRNILCGIGVILVDDVLTTGATLREIAAVIGDCVVGAAVLAHA